MKRNVDLTLDRKFSSNNFSLRNIVNEKVDIPWKIKHKKNFSKFTKVLTGDKRDRKNKILELEYKENKYCERCGLSREKRPWEFDELDLCKKCNRVINDNSDIDGFKRGLWKIKLKRKQIKAITTAKELESIVLEVEGEEEIETTLLN